MLYTPDSDSQARRKMPGVGVKDACKSTFADLLLMTGARPASRTRALQRPHVERHPAKATDVPVRRGFQATTLPKRHCRRAKSASAAYSSVLPIRISAFTSWLGRARLSEEKAYSVRVWISSCAAASTMEST